MGRRELSIDGTFNVRDLGGLPASDGKVVRRGRVYRSGDLSRLTPQGAAQLRSLGLSTVIDLRTERETARFGIFPFAEHGITHRRRPLIDQSAMDEVPPETAPDLLDRLFHRLATEGGQHIGELLTWISEDGVAPVVIHCVAGKDRTGTVVGLLLALLGVPDAEIAADYALSEPALATYLHWASERDPDTAGWMARVPAPLLEANPVAMLAFLTWLREEYGSVEAYALSIGLDRARLDALRTRLLTAPD